VTDYPDNLNVVQAVQHDLDVGVGIKLKLRPMPFPEFNDAIGQRGKVPMAYAGWSADYWDPSNFLDVLLSGDRIVPKGCNNQAFYSNPRVNALLRTAGRDTDPKRRLRLYQQAEALIVEDAPWILLFHLKAYALHQPWVKGYKMHPVCGVKYEQLWLEGARQSRPAAQASHEAVRGEHG